MTEKELIGKIRQLRQIKPKKDWILLTKSQILGEEPSSIEQFSTFLKVSFRFKPAFAILVVFVIFASSFGLAQNSLPGDLIYPLKKITERSQAIFVSEEELPKYNLEIANKRLEELSRIAQTNQVKKLAPAISEFQASVSRAAQNLARIKEPEKAYEAGKTVVVEIKKLEENKQKIETFGVVIGDAEEIENVMCQLVEREIKNLGILTERQQELLEEAEEYLEEDECTLAFEKILLLSNH